MTTNYDYSVHQLFVICYAVNKAMYEWFLWRLDCCYPTISVLRPRPGQAWAVGHGHDLRRLLDSVTFFFLSFLLGTAAAVRCLTFEKASDELYWIKGLEVAGWITICRYACMHVSNDSWSKALTARGCRERDPCCYNMSFFFLFKLLWYMSEEGGV